MIDEDVELLEQFVFPHRGKRFVISLAQSLQRGGVTCMLSWLKPQPRHRHAVTVTPSAAKGVICASFRPLTLCSHNCDRLSTCKGPSKRAFPKQARSFALKLVEKWHVNVVHCLGTQARVCRTWKCLLNGVPPSRARGRGDCRVHSRNIVRTWRS